MAGKHGAPSTGDGKTSKGRKIGKAEVRVQRGPVINPRTGKVERPAGGWMWKQIAKLWGDS